MIVDARKNSDHLKGFIEGSISLPDTDTNSESLAAIINDKHTPVVFYCNGVKCARSVKAAKIAVESGYSNIFWFRGGWDEWINKGFPITK